jgi:hypothetical protein
VDAAAPAPPTLRSLGHGAPVAEPAAAPGRGVLRVVRMAPTPASGERVRAWRVAGGRLRPASIHPSDAALFDQGIAATRLLADPATRTARLTVTTVLASDS